MKALCSFGVCLGLTVLQAAAADWPQWRGPFFNGSTTETNLPAQWSKTENVAWTAPLPGQSGATPIIWGDTVFVSSPDEEKNLLLICLNRADGKERWRKVVGKPDFEKGRNNSASPSPVTDGKRVIAMFATGDIAAFDFQGKELWKRNLASEFGKFMFMWIYGSSPMLYKDRLYVQVVQHEEPIYAHSKDDKPKRDSYLMALEPDTGKTIWRHVRPTDAVSEAQESYATPIPYEGKSGTELMVVGGNYLTAHSASDGKEIWRAGGLNDRGEKYWRIVPSPVVLDDLVVVSGPKRDPVLAIKTGGKGNVTATHTAWKYKEYPTDCVTPLHYRGKLFVFDGDRQTMTALEPPTGKQLWQGRIEGREIFRASPLGADGKIYCISENGTAVVLEAGDEFKVLSTIRMEEPPTRASIAAAHGQLFIRTGKNLYCIQKP